MHSIILFIYCVLCYINGFVTSSNFHNLSLKLMPKYDKGPLDAPNDSYSKSMNFSLEVLSWSTVSISKFRPSNKCAGGHFVNYCSVYKIWRLIVALMSAVWALIDSCDWQFTHPLLSTASGHALNWTIVANHKLWLWFFMQTSWWCHTSLHPSLYTV